MSIECTSITDCLPGIVNSINEIIIPTVNGTPGLFQLRFLYEIPLLKLTKCAENKFISIAGNVTDEIKNQVNQILNITSSTTQEIFYISLGAIVIVFILLTLIIFAAIYWRDTPNVIAATFILALLVIISISIIVYFWLGSIYNSGSTSVDAHITQIGVILTNIQKALLAAACCFGNTNCSIGSPCECSITS